jgi:hypothetical protein
MAVTLAVDSLWTGKSPLGPRELTQTASRLERDGRRLSLLASNSSVRLGFSAQLIQPALGKFVVQKLARSRIRLATNSSAASQAWFESRRVRQISPKAFQIVLLPYGRSAPLSIGSE